jgi:hypothetical protein
MHPVTRRKYIDDKSLQGSLFHATSDGAQTSVHFPRWRAQNQRHNRIAGNFDVLERAKNMDLPVRSIDICMRNEKKNASTHVSARIMRVRLAFSMVNFVLPS